MSVSRILAAAVFAALACGGARAATADRDQPIYLEADRVDIDDVRGVSTYTGAVSIRQGNMRLRGDKVVVYAENRDPARYVATGTPAEFHHRPKPDEAEMVATARELEYAVKSEILQLRGNAVIVQCGDRFEGEQLSYDAGRSRVTAGGGDAGRIRMVIQPQREGTARDCRPGAAPASAAAPAAPAATP